MNLSKLLKVVCSGILVLSSLNGFSQNASPVFKKPTFEEPVFKKDTFNVLNYGAIGNGSLKNTEAFAKAINACSANGGGVVLVPAGLWLTGPIELKSNVNFHLQRGALVQFSSDFNDYPMILSYYEGQKAWRCQSPISAVSQNNIAITGQGVFDGAGDSWRFVKKAKLTGAQWQSLIASGGVLNSEKNTWYPSEGSRIGNDMYSANKLPPVDDKKAYDAIKDYLRPMMVSLIECKSVLIDGPTIQNSPCWTIHLLLCEQLFVKNVNVRNPWYAQNSDGIDIESCNTGEVENCTFDVGDDAICIKSGRDAEGRKRGKPTENFVIKNCIVYHGHGGFVIGSEMSGGVRNLYVENCSFIGTDIGLRFKSSRGRGGIVENIFINGISMINIPAEAIRFDMFYTGTSPIPEGDEKAKIIENKVYPVNEETPQFKNFYIENVNCNGAEQAIFLQGLAEMKIKDIVIKNSSFIATRGFACIDGEIITLDNVKLEISKGDLAFLNNSSVISLLNIDGKMSSGKFLKVQGASSKVNVSSKNGKLTEKDIESSNEVKEKVNIQ
jgi:DNA sulfur modification protein DndE